jgi:hypothetical protein
MNTRLKTKNKTATFYIIRPDRIGLVLRRPKGIFLVLGAGKTDKKGRAE